MRVAKWGQDAIAHLGFVAVVARAIKVAIAQTDGGDHGLSGHVARNFPQPQTYMGTRCGVGFVFVFVFVFVLRLGFVSGLGLLLGSGLGLC